MATAVQVVELALGDRVVHVDGGEQQLVALEHLVETHHASGGLFGDALDAGGQLGPLGGLSTQAALQQAEHDGELGVGCRRWVWNLARLFELDTLVDQQRGVAAVVEDHVGSLWLAVDIGGPCHHLIGAPPVLLECLTLPGKHRHALRILDCASGANSNGSGRVVLSREDVAACPTNLGTQLDEGLDEHRCLNGHVQRTANAGTLEWLRWAVFLAQRAQAGHFVFGEMNLFTAKRGK